jgi:pimeloyl-ACP methyl ester carboxylesterase
MKYILLLLPLSLILAQCTGSKNTGSVNNITVVSPDTLSYFDTARNRQIPVAIYRPEGNRNTHSVPVVFSHGYGANKGGDYLIYSYLANFLTSKGYFVVSIQHELPTDELLAMTGNLQETRRPNWERGVQNIDFVIRKMKTDFPELDYSKLSLIGHSNGGDMTALFAHTFPGKIYKIITLDNRRMALPRTAHPMVFTLRSKDYPADEFVLPTDTEAKKYGITIQFTNINHGSMDNDARPQEQKYINNKIAAYLEK